MKNMKPVWRSLLLLLIGGLLGYAVGLGLDALVGGRLDFSAPLSGLFTLLGAAVSFFFGLVGYRGITRGLVFQVVGTLVGGLFVTGIRALMGLSTFGGFFFSEPAWVFGGLVGALSFLAGVGALTDWFKWAKGEETPEHHNDPEGFVKYFGVSLDHKVIGIQYTITSLVILGVGGTFAMIFRTELASSQLQFLTTTFKAFDQNGLQFYNTLMSLHGMLMIVSILLGIAGVMNYLVPLLLGA